MNRRWGGLAIGTLAILGALAAAAGSSSTGPAAPQQPGQCDPYGDGTCAAPANMVVVNPATAGANDRWVAIAPGASLFVDPHGGNYSTVGPARLASVTAGAPGAIKLVIATPGQWLQEISAANASSLPYVTMQIACRPKAATLCSAASGGPQSVLIQGGISDAAGSSGYGILGSTGTATTTCINPPYGDYPETQQFTCGSIGSGPSTDGDWGSDTSNVDVCGGISYTVNEPGNCSATCGGGNQYQTNYNACGNVVTKGYFGPSCNTQPCCTSNWVKSCSGNLATYSDTGSCHDPSYQVPGGCSEVDSPCSSSCTLGTHVTTIFSSSGSDFCNTDYYDCGSWTGSTAGGTNCTTQYGEETYTQTCTQSPGGGGTITVPIGASCTCVTYQ